MKYRPIIAITGSAGKSTTKEMIASILQTNWTIFKTKRNFNTFHATRKHRKRLNDFHQAAVLEYGMGSKGSVAKHCKAIKPTIGVITNVGTAHIGRHNGDILNIAKGKSQLIKGMHQTGLLFLNADDANSSLLDTKDFNGKIIKVGYKEKADYTAVNIKYNNNGMTFSTKIDSENHEIFIPIFGVHHVINALFAIAVSQQLGFQATDIKEGLANFYRMDRRLKVHLLPNEVSLIDDTYSANPQATIAAIDVLQNIGGQKKVVVLGSMLELGSYSVKGHQEVGKYIAKNNVDLLFTFGKETKVIVDSAIESGFPTDSARHFSTKRKLHSELKKAISKNTTILVKGSNKVQLNKTVLFLLKYFKKSKARRRKRIPRKK